MKKQRNKKGFTLIEVLVVLIIIGVIVALILPNVLDAINQSNEKECASNIRTINTAAQLCFTNTRNWTQCDSQAELTAALPNGAAAPLASWPICPFGVAYTIPAAANPGTGTEVATAAHFATWPPVDANGSVPHQ